MHFIDYFDPSEYNNTHFIAELLHQDWDHHQPARLTGKPEVKEQFFDLFFYIHSVLYAAAELLLHTREITAAACHITNRNQLG